MDWNIMFWIVVVLCATIIIWKIVDEYSWAIFRNKVELQKLEDRVKSIEDKVNGEV